MDAQLKKQVAQAIATTGETGITLGSLKTKIGNAETWEVQYYLDVMDSYVEEANKKFTLNEKGRKFLKENLFIDGNKDAEKDAMSTRI
jgi:hypothetical protein